MASQQLPRFASSAVEASRRRRRGLADGVIEGAPAAGGAGHRRSACARRSAQTRRRGRCRAQEAAITRSSAASSVDSRPRHRLKRRKSCACAGRCSAISAQYPAISPSRPQRQHRRWHQAGCPSSRRGCFNLILAVALPRRRRRTPLFPYDPPLLKIIISMYPAIFQHQHGRNQSISVYQPPAGGVWHYEAW